MATPEGKVKGWLDKMFKAEGVCYFSPQAGPYGSSGVEDRIAIVCGLYLGVEAKADASKKMTAKQELRKQAVLKAGGTHFLVYDKATIEAVRQWILNVRARSPRQESSSVVYERPRLNPCNNTERQASERELNLSASWAGRDDGSKQPGVSYTSANSLLL